MPPRDLVTSISTDQPDSPVSPSRSVGSGSTSPVRLYRKKIDLANQSDSSPSAKGTSTSGRRDSASERNDPTSPPKSSLSGDKESSSASRLSSRGDSRPTGPLAVQRGSSVADSEAIRVFVRVRPMSSSEVAGNRTAVVSSSEKDCTVSVSSGSSVKEFTFDSVFGAPSTQEMVYAKTAGFIVDDVMNGYNGTVFAYGQTGTGKTFTVLGNQLDGEIHETSSDRESSEAEDSPSGMTVAPSAGILPRAFVQIFDRIREAQSKRSFLVHATYVEIYNEELRDLLAHYRGPTAENSSGTNSAGTASGPDSSATSSGPKKLELKEIPGSSWVVAGAKKAVAKSPADLMRVLRHGASSRATAATSMNSESSRSHAIYTITVESTEMINPQSETKAATGEEPDGSSSTGNPKTCVTVGKLNVVDLAGSERQRKSESSGDTLREAASINLSLHALGNVISSLVDPGCTHVPYRDSKLTKLLRDSLGGNAKTTMIATVGPADYNLEETMSTLRYASRAKNIRNKPKVNEDPKDAVIRQFQDEIQRLRAELALYASKTLDPSMDPRRNDQSLTSTGIVTGSSGHNGQFGASSESGQVSHDSVQARLMELQQAVVKGQEEVAAVTAERDRLMKLAKTERENRPVQSKTQKSGDADVEGQNSALVAELADLTAEYRNEREELMDSLLYMQRSLKLKDMIIAKFIRRPHLELIAAACRFDEEGDQWILEHDDLASLNESILKEATLDTFIKANSGADFFDSRSFDQSVGAFPMSHPGILRGMEQHTNEGIEVSRGRGSQSNNGDESVRPEQGSPLRPPTRKTSSSRVGEESSGQTEQFGLPPPSRSGSRVLAMGSPLVTDTIDSQAQGGIEPYYPKPRGLLFRK